MAEPISPRAALYHELFDAMSIMSKPDKKFAGLWYCADCVGWHDNDYICVQSNQFAHRFVWNECGWTLEGWKNGEPTDSTGN